MTPAPLRALPYWLTWRLEPNPGGKPLKVPYYVDGGPRRHRHGSPEDIARLAPRETINGASLVGLAMIAGSGICALDFDNCVIDGVVHPDVLAIAAETYCEYSPSGRGVRAFITGDYGNRKSLGPEHPYGMELFSSTGFVTVTGNVLPVTEALGLEDTVSASPAALALIAKRFPPVQTTASDLLPVGLSLDTMSAMLDALPNDDVPYERYDGKPSWLEVGMALHAETGGSDEGLALWDNWSQRSRKYSNSEFVQSKWDSFRRDEGGKTGRTLAAWSGVSLTPVADASAFDDLSAPVVANRFQAVPISEWADGPPMQWLVRDVLPRAELVVLYGASGAGKSFIALDMAFSIARGIPWRGSPLHQGSVVYIAAEGAIGVRMRAQAYAKHHGISLADIPLRIISVPPNLLLQADALDICRAIGKADLVIVDTAAATTPGANENTSEDVGRLLANCKGIHRATGAVVELVAHAGKDVTKGIRGWSGYHAAADAVLEVIREDDNDVRTLRTRKQKDGVDDRTWGFRLENVTLGIDEWDEPITSCVVVEAVITAPRRNLGVVDGAVATAVSMLADASGKARTEDVIGAAARTLAPPLPGTRDRRFERVRRALQASIDAGRYTATDDTIS